MNPFLVLNVPITATDAEVRAAYHELLRRHPPERDAEKFQAVQEAYTALRTEPDRWRQHLFRPVPAAESPLEALEDFSHLPGRMRPPGAPAFRQLLAACAIAAQRDTAKS